MAYQSKFTGETIDNLLTSVQNWVSDDTSFKEELWAKITPQDVIDKINAVDGNIVFTKFVDAQAGAGNTVD